MTLKDLKQILSDCPYFQAVNFTDIHWTADDYFLPSRDWLENELAPAVKKEFLLYNSASNRRDCTQATRIALALADKAMAQREEEQAIAVGKISGMLFSKLNEVVSSTPAMHSTCIVVLNDNLPYFYEPQNCLITPASDVSPFDFDPMWVEL